MATTDVPDIIAFALRHLRVSTFHCSRQIRAQGYTLEPRTLDNYNLIYVTRGRVVWVVDSVQRPLAPGWLTIVPPRVPHSAFSSTKDVELGSIHLTIALPGGEDLLAALAPPPLQRFARGSRFDRYFRAAMDEFDRGEAVARPLMPFWSELIARELLRHDSELGVLRAPPFDPLVARLIDELTARITDPIDLPSLARRAGCSAQHLNRLFRRALGLTPLQCLAHLRLERAAALLREGKLTVAAVAGRVGIPDPYYFSRVFRAAYGSSPSEYRDASS